MDEANSYRIPRVKKRRIKPPRKKGRPAEIRTRITAFKCAIVTTSIRTNELVKVLEVGVFKCITVILQAIIYQTLLTCPVYIHVYTSICMIVGCTYVNSFFTVFFFADVLHKKKYIKKKKLAESSDAQMI